MNFFRVLADQQGQAVDSVLVGSCEARGLADAVVVCQMPEDVESFFGLHPRAVESGSFPFGEAFAADRANEASDRLRLAGPAFLLDVVFSPLPVERALGVLATEPFKGSHGSHPWPPVNFNRITPMLPKR